MSEERKAVFISYASQDAGSARRIADALRAAGTEVWFDQSELRGGDAWDQKIRKQIRECALFLPVISTNTQSRAEGYFRLEWRLADQRTHLMGRSKAFLVPVCTDATRDTDADVPDSFLAVQWTRLTDENRTDFVAQVQRLLNTAGMRSAEVSTVATAISAPPVAVRQRVQRRDSRLPLLVAALAAAVVLGGLLLWQSHRAPSAPTASRDAIPRIEQAIATGDWETAYAAAQLVPAGSRDAIRLEYLWPQFSWVTTIPSDPPGATVYRRPYNSRTDAWQKLGVTPLAKIRVPFGLSRLRLELASHAPIERTLGGEVLAGKELAVSRNDLTQFFVSPEIFKLDPTETLPVGKVRVPGWREKMEGDNVELGDFFLGKYEVTNREYQAFVDAGGYQRQEYWEHAVVREGTTIAWDEAIKLFTDKTGRLGPSTWIGGTFPDGQEDFPVGGVSWYEAAACARFLGQELPTVFHWRRAFDTGSFAWMLPASNVGRENPAKVGQFAGVSWVGAYDLAGNVREWIFNAVGDRRFILGGGWSDPLYMAQHMDYAQPPLDRSAINGFRLSISREPVAIIARARKPLPQGVARDFLAETPVSDEVFDAYRKLYSYEATPLDARIEDSKDAPYWTRHRISFAGARRGERVPLYLFLPKSGQPPYQTILFWPGAEAGVLESIDEHDVKLDFALKGGRAVALPVFRNTFERRDRTGSPDSISSRDALIERVNDVRRSLDYLETRTDIDTESLAYFGFSQGSASAPFVLSLEPRLHAAVLTVGGFYPKRASSAELDAFNYITRIKTPVLLLDGEFDSVFPLETSAKPFYQLLGTPVADKKFVVTPGGHFVPRETLIRETLDWLDHYLGRPAR